MPKPTLTIQLLQREANIFAEAESTFPEPALYGVTDGKAVGTYVERKFKAYLETKYTFEMGNAASGIDLTALEVDIKVTSSSRSPPVHSNLHAKRFLGLVILYLFSFTQSTMMPPSKQALWT